MKQGNKIWILTKFKVMVMELQQWQGQLFLILVMYQSTAKVEQQLMKFNTWMKLEWNLAQV